MSAPTLPHAVILMHAKRERRMHHFLWHQTRNMWLFWDEDTRSKIRALGWEPPRPARRPGLNGRPEMILDNNSGEDFLYMHRQMIHTTNLKLAEVGDPNYLKVEGWREIPRPDNQDYPVPPVWDTDDQQFNEFLENVKSREFFDTQFVPWENEYKSLEELAKMELGELGARIESTIHNMMHMRWCAEIQNFRSNVNAPNAETIDPQWDNPNYRWLGDEYSSHVNPTFWKLHGWCDDRIDDWMKAKNLTGEVSWQGTWVGKMPPHPQPESLHSMLALRATSVDTVMPAHDHTSEMEAVARIILRSGKLCHFYDKVVLPELKK